VNWIRIAKAGNDEYGYSKALLGIDEEGWLPLQIRASEYEAALIGESEPPQDIGLGNQNADDRRGVMMV
jgi:hypothetical protein